MGLLPCGDRVGSELQGARESQGRTSFTQGVSSHAHAGDRKHCSTQHDSALLESGERRAELELRFSMFTSEKCCLAMMENLCSDGQ